MYKQGKYTYKSIEAYQRLLIIVGLIFIASSLALLYLKYNMNQYLYCFTQFISITMILHLGLRYAKSKKWMKKYIFDKY